jgi:Rod binding domain-containing protein
MLYVNPLASHHSSALGFGNAAKGLADRERTAFLELEQLLIKQMMKEMRATVPDSGLLLKKQEKRVYEEMLDDAFARSMAESGQMGVARMMARHTLPNAAPGLEGISESAAAGLAAAKAYEAQSFGANRSSASAAPPINKLGVDASG